jgi:hypothetical protein
MKDLIVYSNYDEAYKAIKELGLDPIAEKNYIDQAFEFQLWNTASTKATPLEAVRTREGFKKDGVAQILEYVPEIYCLTELNRIYPGWWMEDMKRSIYSEIVALKTVMVEGYLCVKHVLPSGATSVTKRWAFADNPVKFYQNTNEPVDIGNHLKGARTEWLRAACKWYGIGLDIYHQKITPAHRSMFEDRIRAWNNYATHWKTVISSVQTGKAFRDVLRQMPSELQVARMVSVLEYIPDDDHPNFWKEFAKHSNSSDEKTTEFNNFLNKIEQIAQQLKTKKENTNG